MRLSKKEVKIVSEKKFNPDLWKPLGIKPVEVREVIQPGKLNSFLDYQAPEDANRDGSFWQTFCAMFLSKITLFDFLPEIWYNICNFKRKELLIC